jgi:hypothetical protein
MPKTKEDRVNNIMVCGGHVLTLSDGESIASA